MITLILIGQMILGIVCDKMFDVGRNSVPIIDKIHWWTGRSLSVLAIANIILGILAYNKFTGSHDIPIILTFIALLVSGVCTFVFGHLYLKKSTHTAATLDKF